MYQLSIGKKNEAGYSTTGISFIQEISSPTTFSGYYPAFLQHQRAGFGIRPQQVGF
jgi:hypothetical protein